MNVIGLDIGTTTICGIAVDAENGRLLKSVTLPNDSFIDGKPFEKIQSPEKIIEKVTALAENLFNEFSPVCAVGITGQMHGIVYLNSEGKAVSPLYTWQDGSGNEKLDDSNYAKNLSEITGYAAASGFGGTTYYYHSKNNLVPENAVIFCTIHDYAAMVLTGRIKPLMHSSDAASFGLFDLKKGCFDKKAIEKAGLDYSYFPEVTDKYEAVGEYKGVPVCCAIGDNQASFIGSVRDIRESGLINIGTGAQMSCAVPAFPEGTDLDVRPLTDKNYIIAGSALCGGRAYAMLERLFRRVAEEVTGNNIASAYKMMDRLMDGIEVKSPITVDTRFGGTRADPSIRGSITGIGTDNFDIETLCDGFMTGMATELYGLYDEMKPCLCAEMSHMIASGNGVRFNSSLKKRLERVFGVEILIPAHKEEGCFGALLYALTASGVYDTLTEAQKLIKYE